MSITTDLAQHLGHRPGTCGSCAAGVVFLPAGDGRYITVECPCTALDPIEHVPAGDAPIPDPQTEEN